MNWSIIFSPIVPLPILLAAAAAMAQAGPPVSSPGVGEKGAETTETSKAVPVKRPEEEGPASATNPEPMP